jgi:glycosyltransferase involved in cell wall biosynthesis
MKFATGMPARAFAFATLAGEICRRHSAAPFDFVYLFNAADLGLLRSRLNKLPPVVLHPEVHAAGELRWLRRERGLSARTHSRRLQNAAVEAMMMARAYGQRRDVLRAERVIAPSRRFAALLAEDYQVPIERLHVVPNVIDLERFFPTPSQAGSRLRLLFVSRIAVRKGVELVVELSRRLTDLAGEVELDIIGDRSLWSDYRHLLAGLDGRIAHYDGPLHGPQVADAMRQADVFLCPSHYEPFGLTLGEALASGLPVVASDSVGAAEDVTGRSVEQFRAGDIDEFERAVRRMLHLVSAEPDGMQREARAEAERLFSPGRVADAMRLALS